MKQFGDQYVPTYISISTVKKTTLITLRKMAINMPTNMKKEYVFTPPRKDIVIAKKYSIDTDPEFDMDFVADFDL